MVYGLFTLPTASSPVFLHPQILIVFSELPYLQAFCVPEVSDTFMFGTIFGVPKSVSRPSAW